MYENLFETLSCINYSQIDMEDNEVKFLMQRYKKQILVLPQSNYTPNTLYIPEMEIKFKDIVFRNNIHVEFKYLISINGRKFLLMQSCFCGKKGKDFKPDTPMETLDKIRLVKDKEGDEDLVVVPEVELTIDNIKTGKYVKEYRVKNSWLVSVYMKLQEIKNEVDEQIEKSEENDVYSDVAKADDVVEKFCEPSIPEV